MIDIRYIFLSLLAVQTAQHEAQAAEMPQCPSSVFTSESLTKQPDVGWTAKNLSASHRLTDLQFSQEEPVEGVEYKLVDAKFPDGNFRRLILPASGSSNNVGYSLYYLFDSYTALYAICRYENTSVSLIKKINMLSECRVEHSRATGDVSLSECN